MIKPTASEHPTLTQIPPSMAHLERIPHHLSLDVAGSDPRRPLKLGGTALLWMCFQTLGIIYSDIGTSPLYVLNGIWSASGPAPSTEDVIGGVSAIVWSLTLVPLIKYVCPPPRLTHSYTDHFILGIGRFAIRNQGGRRWYFCPISWSLSPLHHHRRRGPLSYRRVRDDPVQEQLAHEHRGTTCQREVALTRLGEYPILPYRIPLTSIFRHSLVPRWLSVTECSPLLSPSPVPLLVLP